MLQVEALVKEVAAHEDKVEGLRKEVRRQAREASQIEKKVSHSMHYSFFKWLVIAKKNQNINQYTFSWGCNVIFASSFQPVSHRHKS